jgi:sugar/nucleoside kinase (ribokinase family)
VLVDAHRAARITSANVLVLGETQVELVCQRHVGGLAEADAFVPFVGGTAARVASIAASLGASVALAGCAGDDEWGRWLRDRLAGGGVDVSRFELRSDGQTQLALVTVGADGQPSLTRYGHPPAPSELEPSKGALFISLADPGQRELVMRARAHALEHGRPVVFAPGLCVERWRSQADAAASANACVSEALLVRVSAAEAEVMTGEGDPERAAVALTKAGARLVVITLGASDGVILRGELRADVDGVAPGRMVSTRGADDTFTGVLLARLTLSDFYPPVVAASLREAAVAAAEECSRW